MADPVTEARALLFQFQRSSLKACHVVTQSFELFASRDPAIRAPSTSMEPTVEAAPVAETIVEAPHVATLVTLEAPGTIVAAGGAVGRIALLDETIDLVSDTGGTIVAHRAAPGTLVEYGEPILTIAA
ncbi:hypothetical protein M0208_16325 [Sphingomonas sp. SUN019]|uniref:hypothetical protein n=1 Tax=Sphingomonas sp. SUN019 TaxID=2937788 RepID=UPI002164DCC8|nr:hypothetical protein [Sphingomonas sp. SUN019]UVO51999.1 hypothetical protein M0208_16325 [Sphingomonas sp. SUN019]